MGQIRGMIQYLGAFNMVSALLRIILAVIAGSIGFEITVTNKNNQEQIRQALNQIDGVRFAIRG